jgi:RNase P subunit RPR2
VDLQEEKRQKEEQAARHKAQLAAQDKQHEEYLARMQKVSENKKSAMTNDQRRVGMSKCSSILEKLVGVQHANA